uniref:Uncharacterized protein n=1 Tax=Anguilla anguilla TaxID=7936 RepID=A0A0E9T462_ANGAN
MRIMMQLLHTQKVPCYEFCSLCARIRGSSHFNDFNERVTRYILADSKTGEVLNELRRLNDEI